jgi:hypothetical protein
MGKRSDFEREKLDFYPTPYSALKPLLRHLPVPVKFAEPCAGDGRLIDMLVADGHECVASFDVVPRRDGIECKDASFMVSDDLNGAEMIITNPPWDRTPLHQIIERGMALCPTWLLFDADWMHTRQASPYLPFCAKIVSVGRVKWIEDSDMAGKDNCCWYLFNGEFKGATKFFGRPHNG